MVETWAAQLERELAQARAAQAWRQRPVVQSAQGPRVQVEGQRVLAFASNDYLGLAADARVRAALAEAAQRYGAGAAASPWVSGHMQPHAELEQALCAWLEQPGALLFSSGYQANLGVVSALVGRGDVIFADRLNHASLNDAMVLSRAKIVRYRHADPEHLAWLMARTPGRRALVLTDSVFSMDGDLAPLPAYIPLLEQHDALMLVDDAHALGVLGEQGRGSLSYFGLQHPRVLQGLTFGKAMGLAGAAVLAASPWIDYLQQKTRTAIYSTAMPPALAHALSCALGLLRLADDRRAQLQGHVQQLRAGLQGLTAWRLLPSNTAIQPLVVGSNAAALALSAALRQAGLWVPAIRPPTVPEGQARLRISLSAGHTSADVAILVAQLQALHGAWPAAPDSNMEVSA